jgi:ABC-2 type transport system ATP-binding protein
MIREAEYDRPQQTLPLEKESNMSILDDRPTLQGIPARDGTPSSAVRITAVEKSYGAFGVLNGISLDIAPNEVFGILGPNGAGKTTLIECIVGLRTPDSGTISVLGMDPTKDRSSFTARVAVQPQDASLFESLRVGEALALFADFYAHPYAADEVLDLIGLAEFEHHPTKKLSGGQRRRLLLGVAMIGRPELIVLDEPSAGLDPQARRNLWSVIRGLKAEGTTVIVTTHHMEEASELCDRLAIMVDGRVAALGEPGELVRDLAATQTVTFTSDADAAEVRSRLNVLDVVSDIDVRSGSTQTFKVSTVDADAVLAHITTERDWRARNFDISSGDLENVFLKLAATADHSSRTGRRGRKARKAD